MGLTYFLNIFVFITFVFWFCTVLLCWPASLAFQPKCVLDGSSLELVVAKASQHNSCGHCQIEHQCWRVISGQILCWSVNKLTFAHFFLSTCFNTKYHMQLCLYVRINCVHQISHTIYRFWFLRESVSLKFLVSLYGLHGPWQESEWFTIFENIRSRVKIEIVRQRACMPPSPWIQRFPDYRWPG